MGCQTTLIEQSFTADTSWHTTTLDNGLILHIKEVPGQTVSTRFLVRTGSRDEADDQKGYAHFLEHMAFNGTEAFPKNDIVALFGEEGVAFGQHLNAFTTHANTVYQVDLPSDDKLTNALTWFREIATSLSLDPEEVSRERGVVLGEMRLRSQTIGNLDFELYRLIAEQLYGIKGDIIGNEDSIQNISEQRLRDFYQTHYTPNRSEIFIAGDIDSTSVITEVNTIFGQWFAPENGSPINNISPLKRSKSTVLGGINGSFPSTTILLDLGPNTMVSAADFEDFAAANILTDAISTRLNDRARDLNIPIQNTYAELIQWFERVVMRVHISYEAQNQQTAMQFLAKELATLRDHGLSSLEVDAQASAFLKLESNFADNYTARNYADDHVFFRMIGRQTLSPETYKSLSEALVYRADKTWFNKRLTSLLESNDVQTVVAIDHLYFFTEARQEQLAFVSDMESTFKLSGKALILPEVLSDFPQPGDSGEIVSIEELDPNTSKWQLNNGVVVYLRSMPNAGDEVHVYAGSKGGLAALSPSLRPAGDLIAGAYAESGLGGFSSNDYNRLMLKENAFLEPIVWEHLHGFHGKSTKASLPLVLASIYQAFSTQHSMTRCFLVTKSNLSRAIGSISNP
ncbi:M16 family metallopeptidase [Vibrio variabilis]|uniref:M16 family metallopeptidase n=1 Tax=Vibrio variabilis TaxID=990271 RepID=UPI0013A68B49|nr:insulinase family protein [Vibrio variabilis]